MTKMGRPFAEKPKRNRVIIRFDDFDYDRIRECAEKENLTVTEFLRNIIKEYLSRK